MVSMEWHTFRQAVPETAGVAVAKHETEGTGCRRIAGHGRRFREVTTGNLSSRDLGLGDQAQPYLVGTRRISSILKRNHFVQAAITCTAIFVPDDATFIPDSILSCHQGIQSNILCFVKKAFASSIVSHRWMDICRNRTVPQN